MSQLGYTPLFTNTVAASTIALQFHRASAATSSSATAITAFNTTGSTNLIVIVIGTETNSTTLTDSNTNTWTLIRTDSTTSDFLKTYYCFNPVLSSTHSFAVTSVSGFPAIAIAGFSGVAVSPLDQQNGFGNTGVTSIRPGSITPSINGCLVISGMMTDFGSTFPTAVIDSGFTVTDYIPLSGSSVGTGLAYLLQGAAAAVNPTWSNFAPGHAVASIVSFK